MIELGTYLAERWTEISTAAFSTVLHAPAGRAAGSATATALGLPPAVSATATAGTSASAGKAGPAVALHQDRSR